MTMSQDEIRHLVMLRDPRIWPLYGKRIIEWNEGQARAAARQLVHSIECSAGDGPISVVDPVTATEATSQDWDGAILRS